MNLLGAAILGACASKHFKTIPVFLRVLLKCITFYLYQKLSINLKKSAYSSHLSHNSIIMAVLFGEYITCRKKEIVQCGMGMLLKTHSA